jgi:transketolase
MTEPAMTDPAMTYEDQLVALMLEDPRIIVLTAENRAAIRGLPQRLPSRFVDVGICEQTMIGAAAGLALRGRVPVVHALATFLTLRAFEFIRTDVGIAGLPVKLVGYVPGFLSTANGPTHQAIDDIGLMRAIPGMQVFCPADRAELLALLPSVLASEAPAYIRYHDAAPAVRHAHLAPDRAEWLARGSDVTLVSYGHLVAEVVEAAALLDAAGVSTGVLNLRCLEPVDEEALLEAAADTLVVTIEDHFGRGGLRSILAELALAHGLRVAHLPIDLGARWFAPGLLRDVLRHEGFDAPQLAARVLAAVEGGAAPKRPLRPAQSEDACI